MEVSVVEFNAWHLLPFENCTWKYMIFFFVFLILRSKETCGPYFKIESYSSPSLAKNLAQFWVCLTSKKNILDYPLIIINRQRFDNKSLVIMPPEMLPGLPSCGKSVIIQWPQIVRQVMFRKYSLCTFDAQIYFFVDSSWKYIKLANLGDHKF